MRAQLLINMIMRRVSKICDFVPYTDINPQLRHQRIIRDVLIYDSQAVCNATENYQWSYSYLENMEWRNNSAIIQLFILGL